MEDSVCWSGFRPLVWSDLDWGRDGLPTARPDEVRTRGKRTTKDEWLQECHRVKENESFLSFSLLFSHNVCSYLFFVHFICSSYFNQGDAPNHNQLPVSDIVGVTAVLLTCSYKDSQEFLRVGYYVNVEYDSPELNENPPATPTIERLHRHILAEKPRVTKFQIDWDDMPQAMGGNVDENPAAAQANAEGLLQKGSQFQDRQDLMSHAALAEAAQNFQGGAQMWSA